MAARAADLNGDKAARDRTVTQARTGAIEHHSHCSDGLVGLVADDREAVEIERSSFNGKRRRRGRADQIAIQTRATSNGVAAFDRQRRPRGLQYEE